jgi:hypothetical protein
MPPGRKLRVNAVTPRAGSILVEVAGADRKPLEGRSFAEATPIVGDHTATVLNWNGNDDLGPSREQPDLSPLPDESDADFVRLPPRGLALFEAVINAVHKAAPGAAIAFNTRPEDSADAAARSLVAGSRAS